VIELALSTWKSKTSLLFHKKKLLRTLAWLLPNVLKQT
jgi:hypothetical protein